MILLSLLSALDHSQPDIGSLSFISTFSWGFPILGIFLLTSKSWVSNLSILLSVASKFGAEGHKNFPAAGYLVASAFLMIASINLCGLLPLTFTPTTSIWFTSSLALSAWTAIIMSSLAFSAKSFLAGLVPSGVPVAMGAVLSAIEFLSVVIRPITLMVRLAANISTGHILMALMATSVMPSVIPLMLGFNIFETGVGLLQAYIFTLLLKIYLGEHPSEVSAITSVFGPGKEASSSPQVETNVPDKNYSSLSFSNFFYSFDSVKFVF